VESRQFRRRKEACRPRCFQLRQFREKCIEETFYIEWRCIWIAVEILLEFVEMFVVN